MKRKRFIKLLMSHGAQRNDAQLIAKQGMKEYEDYRSCYIIILSVLVDIMLEECVGRRKRIEGMRNIIE